MGKVLLGNAACMKGVEVPHFSVVGSRNTVIQTPSLAKKWNADVKCLFRLLLSHAALKVVESDSEWKSEFDNQLLDILTKHCLEFFFIN